MQICLCQFFRRVFSEIPGLMSLITQRWVIDPAWPLYCLSVDESRDTTKHIFTTLIVVMWEKKIRDKWSKLYLKLKHFLHWFEKYLFGYQQIFKPEVMIKYRNEWSNWAFSRSFSKYSHVTHHFAAFELLITISTFSVWKKHSGTKIAKFIIFWIFSKWRHSDRKWSLVVPSITKWPWNRTFDSK